ncbi:MULTISPECIES: hypothetical protein [unclassified Microcoleus]
MLLVADIDRSLCVRGRSHIRKKKGRSPFHFRRSLIRNKKGRSHIA